MSNYDKEYQERLELFNKYKNTAYNIAHKYAGNSNNLDDLIQVALMELWECSERYEKEKGVKFITYSTNCITSRVKGWKWEKCGINPNISGNHPLFLNVNIKNHCKKIKLAH